MNYGFNCKKTFAISMHNNISVLRMCFPHQEVVSLGWTHTCLKITLQATPSPHSNTHHFRAFRAVRNLPSRPAAQANPRVL